MRFGRLPQPHLFARIFKAIGISRWVSPQSVGLRGRLHQGNMWPSSAGEKPSDQSPRSAKEMVAKRGICDAARQSAPFHLVATMAMCEQTEGVPIPTSFQTVRVLPLRDRAIGVQGSFLQALAINAILVDALRATAAESQDFWRRSA